VEKCIFVDIAVTSCIAEATLGNEGRWGLRRDCMEQVKRYFLEFFGCLVFENSYSLFSFDFHEFAFECHLDILFLNNFREWLSVFRYSKEHIDCLVEFDLDVRANSIGSEPVIVEIHDFLRCSRAFDRHWWFSKDHFALFDLRSKLIELLSVVFPVNGTNWTLRIIESFFEAYRRTKERGGKTRLFSIRTVIFWIEFVNSIFDYVVWVRKYELFSASTLTV